MEFINRLLGKTSIRSSSSSSIDPPASNLQRYKYEGPKIPQTPLTPREIEELHAKLYPEKHQPDIKLVPQPESQRASFSLSLEEKFSSVAIESTLALAQSQSLLFRRLPKELRMQIWRHAIGSQKLYLTTKNGRLVQSGTMDDYGWWPKRGLLNVSMVCRAAYIESISYLYSSNTFCFGFDNGGSKEALIHLYTMLPKQHVTSIRHLQVGWHFTLGISQYYDSHPQAWDFSLTIPAPEPAGIWEQVCAELAGMSHLRSLKVVVWTSGDRRTGFADLEREMLQPLVEMKHLKYFDIYLPWAQSDRYMWNDAPFHVTRCFQDRERFGVSVPLLDDEDW